jgi:hypothetical protein
MYDDFEVQTCNKYLLKTLDNESCNGWYKFATVHQSYKSLKFQQLTKKIKHASHRTLSNCLREILSKLNHLYKSVCSKLKCYQVALTNFCNSSKLTSKLVSVSVGKVSRELERIERECLLINFTKREL